MSDQEASPAAPSHELIANSVKLNLFAAFFRVENPGLLGEVFERHVFWVAEQEAKGRVFLSGPLTPQDAGKEASGLAVYRVGSLAEADALAITDPFVAEGVMSVQVRPWTVLGGSMSFALRLSNSSVEIR